MMESLGIIAGNREFPLLLARSARASGVRRIVAVGFPGITSSELESLVDDMTWVGLGQVGKLIRAFESRGISDLVLIGQIPHRLVLGALKFDLEGLRFFRSLGEKNARTVLGGLIEKLEKEGFRVLDSTVFLQDAMALRGILTRRSPTPAQLRDLAYGWKVAKTLADLEAGQSVVVKRGVMVALEGMEGTDATILRGFELAGKGIVVVKAARSNQDMRYDVPVVGLQTLDILHKAKASVIGLEAGRTLILEREEFLAAADRFGIVVVGLEGNHECD